MGKELLLVIVGHRLDFWIEILDLSKVFLEASDFLTHLIRITDWNQVAFVFLRVENTNIVITPLHFWTAITSEAACMVFYSL